MGLTSQGTFLQQAAQEPWHIEGDFGFAFSFMAYITQTYRTYPAISPSLFLSLKCSVVSHFIPSWSQNARYAPSGLVTTESRLPLYTSPPAIQCFARFLPTGHRSSFLCRVKCLHSISFAYKQPSHVRYMTPVGHMACHSAGAFVKCTFWQHKCVQYIFLLWIQVSYLSGKSVHNHPVAEDNIAYLCICICSTLMHCTTNPDCLNSVPLQEPKYYFFPMCPSPAFEQEEL